MEVSENSQVGNNLKEIPDDSGKLEVEVEVNEVDSGEAIEPVTKQDGPEPAAVEKEAESLSLGSGNVEEKVEEATAAVVASDLPVSDTNVEASSVGKEAVDAKPNPSVLPSSDATVDGGVPQVSEIPRGTEDLVVPKFVPQPATLTHQARASWRNCCGLFEVLKGSNQ